MRGSLATVCHRCVAGGAQALPRCSAALGAELPGDADRGGASARGAPCLQPWHSQSVQEVSQY